MQSRERVVEGFDRLSPRRGAEDEASSLALVLDLDQKFVFKSAARPIQVNHEPAGLPVREVMTSRRCAMR
jgi:hypothetical protein